MALRRDSFEDSILDSGNTRLALGKEARQESSQYRIGIIGIEYTPFAEKL
jgi:hypothetical protein